MQLQCLSHIPKTSSLDIPRVSYYAKMYFCGIVSLWLPNSNIYDIFGLNQSCSFCFSRKRFQLVILITSIIAANAEKENTDNGSNTWSRSKSQGNTIHQRSRQGVDHKWRHTNLSMPLHSRFHNNPVIAIQKYFHWFCVKLPPQKQGDVVTKELPSPPGHLTSYVNVS